MDFFGIELEHVLNIGMNSDRFIGQTEVLQKEIERKEQHKQSEDKTQEKNKNCHICRDHESFEKAYNDLSDRLNEAENQKADLEMTKIQLQTEIGLVKDRSDKLTQLMAKTLEDQNVFEDISNPLCSAKLAERLYSIKNAQFDYAIEALDTTVKDEIKVIEQLTLFMKASYKKCCHRADHQLRSFLLLNDYEEIPTKQEKPDLYRERCRISSNGDRKDKVVKDIVNDVMKDVNVDDVDIDSETFDTLETFLREFTDVVWLMTVSEDRLVLDFDVLGRIYCGDIAKRFTTYTTGTGVEGPVNTVVGVVWPCVTSLDGQRLSAKGWVIVSNVTNKERAVLNCNNETPVISQCKYGTEIN